MERKAGLIILVAISTILVAGCTQQPIGGERDEHGCLGPAGYAWNEDVGACVREWELNDEQKQAAEIAVGYVGYKYATTIIEVTTAQCQGCFVVRLEQGENRDAIIVDIENWAATAKTVTRHACTEEEKQAEICTLEYMPVCGFKPDGTSKTYGNGCQACADDVDYWELGECEEVSGEINNFEQCINAGNPAMESYPRQCMANGRTFTEEHCSSEGYVLTLIDAKQIAIDSECGDRLRESYVCNEDTGTYWIDLDIEKEGCNPACVVDIVNRTAEINWRCTGALPP